jgi:hypothetical protein
MHFKSMADQFLYFRSMQETMLDLFDGSAAIGHTGHAATTAMVRPHAYPQPHMDIRDAAERNEDAPDLADAGMLGPDPLMSAHLAALLGAGSSTEAQWGTPNDGEDDILLPRPDAPEFVPEVGAQPLNQLSQFSEVDAIGGGADGVANFDIDDPSTWNPGGGDDSMTIHNGTLVPAADATLTNAAVTQPKSVPAEFTFEEFLNIDPDLLELDPNLFKFGDNTDLD